MKSHTAVYPAVIKFDKINYDVAVTSAYAFFFLFGIDSNWNRDER